MAYDKSPGTPGLSSAKLQVPVCPRTLKPTPGSGEAGRKGEEVDRKEVASKSTALAVEEVKQGQQRWEETRKHRSVPGVPRWVSGACLRVHRSGPPPPQQPHKRVFALGTHGPLPWLLPSVAVTAPPLCTTPPGTYLGEARGASGCRRGQKGLDDLGSVETGPLQPR